MKTISKIVLSASRRTDIPAFYMDWFMKRIEEGFFEVKNPYNARITRVVATPETIHTIVFWSKNFGPFIRGGYGKDLQEMGYHLFFNFTINTHDPLLEPNVPPLEERLDQLRHLSGSYHPQSITWRFDPVCIYKAQNGTIRNNLNDFKRIAHTAARSGITRCVTSFVDIYPKVKKRTRGMNRFEFIPITLSKQKAIILDMHRDLDGLDITLQTCCEKNLTTALPDSPGIHAGACIPNDLLMELFGGRLSLRKDTGQRVKAGCGCRISSDIGSYEHHPCFHDCLFCYANPSRPVLSEKNRARGEERRIEG